MVFLTNSTRWTRVFRIESRFIFTQLIPRVSWSPSWVLQATSSGSGVCVCVYTGKLQQYDYKDSIQIFHPLGRRTSPGETLRNTCGGELSLSLSLVFSSFSSSDRTSITCPSSIILNGYPSFVLSSTLDTQVSALTHTIFSHVLVLHHHLLPLNPFTPLHSLTLHPLTLHYLALHFSPTSAPCITTAFYWTSCPSSSCFSTFSPLTPAPLLSFSPVSAYPPPTPPSLDLPLLVPSVLPLHFLPSTTRPSTTYPSRFIHLLVPFHRLPLHLLPLRHRPEDQRWKLPAGRRFGVHTFLPSVSNIFMRLRMRIVQRGID